MHQGVALARRASRAVFHRVARVLYSVRVVSCVYVCFYLAKW